MPQLRLSLPLLLTLLACATVAAASPQLQLDTLGGDAWTLSKRVEGRVSGGTCAAVELHASAGTVPAWSDGSRFAAEVPLQRGENAVEAVCKDGGGVLARSQPQRWQVSLDAGPRAFVRTVVDADRIWLDSGRSQRAASRPAPWVRIEWHARAGNPAPLPLASVSGTLDAAPQTGERLQLRPPAVDGDYYVILKVTDAAGRSDESVGMFRVTGGEPREVDLESEHPRWVDGAVLYGVVPFFFGEGRFDDVRRHLDEIAVLGATIIWLSPVNASAEDDFGYAVTDPFRLRPSFGTEAEFRELVDAAHARGLKVIMDFVPNHLSDHHPYYLHAQRHGRRSPYYDWFERDETGEATSYFDWGHLKNLDYDHPEVQNYVIAAAAHWVEHFGIDGFRVDVGWGVRQRAPEFWERWREELKRIDPDLFLLAEAPARDGYYAANGFDAAYDWGAGLGEWAWKEVFTTAGRADLDRLRQAITNGGRGYPPDTLALRFLNNNDTGERFITRHGLGLTRVAAALTFTLPGLPLVYTGDEIGAEYEPYDEGPALDWRDRHGLRPYYEKLAGLRRELPALASRELRLVGNDRADAVLSFIRPGERGEDVLVALNFSDRPVIARFTSGQALSGELEETMSGARTRIDPARPSISLPPHGVAVLKAAAGG